MSQQNINKARNNDGNTSPIDEMFDTTGLLLDYFAHWKWFVICALLFIIGAYFKIATIVPTYSVNASIYLNKETSEFQNAFTSGDANNPLFAMKSYIDETELEILKSSNNVLNIVKSLDMSYSYWTVGNFRDIPMYQDNAVEARVDSVALNNLESPIMVLVSNAEQPGTYDIEGTTYVDGVKDEQTVKGVTLPYDLEMATGTVSLTRAEHIPALVGIEKIIIRNPEAVATAVSGAFSIEFEEKAPTIVRIAYNTNIPMQGVDVINTLVDFYNRQIIEDKNRSAIQTEAFILDRLVMINDELHDVEQRLLDYRQEHNITDLQLQVSTNLQRQGTTQNQLADIDAQERIITEIESIIRKADEYSPLPSATSDAALNTSIEAYNRKVVQLTRLLESAGEDNPVVRQLKDELMRDKSRILQNIATIKSGIHTRRQGVEAIENKSSGQLASLPPVDKGLQEIFREQQVKVNIYTFLLQKREEIALQKTLATPTARLIDDPRSGVPVSPNKKMIYIIAFLLGLAVPAVIIALRRMFFPVFRDQEELQRLTNVPIIGEISVDQSKEDTPIVVGTNVSTAIAELFRLLRNNIGFTKNGAMKKVILITSSISGEGKTFIATNLAMTYALTGKKVCVVGMDIRRPVLAHKFNLTNQQGVTTFLSGQANDISALIHRDTVCDNLYILPAGPVPPNPNELLLSENMTKMMDQLRHDFDIVVLDTAPIGVISDSFLVIPHSDIQLYVARASFSTRSCLKVLHQAVRDNRLSDPYIVLNGVDMSSGSYSYRKYGHYFRDSTSTYGYGYSSDVKTKKKK